MERGGGSAVGSSWGNPAGELTRGSAAPQQKGQPSGEDTKAEMAVGYGFVSCSCACAEHTDVQGAKAHGYRLKHMNIYTCCKAAPHTPRA